MNLEDKKKGLVVRTTVYLTQYHKDLVIDKDINLSGYLKEKLEQDFNEDDMNLKITRLIQQIENLKEELNNATKSLDLLKKVKEDQELEEVKYKEFNEKQKQFFKFAKERLSKNETDLINLCKDYKETFNTVINYQQLKELLE